MCGRPLVVWCQDSRDDGGFSGGGEAEAGQQGETIAKARQEDEQVEAIQGGDSELGEEGGFLSAMASKVFKNIRSLQHRLNLL